MVTVTDQIVRSSIRDRTDLVLDTLGVFQMVRYVATTYTSAVAHFELKRPGQGHSPLICEFIEFDGPSPDYPPIECPEIIESLRHRLVELRAQGPALISLSPFDLQPLAIVLIVIRLDGTATADLISLSPSDKDLDLSVYVEVVPTRVVSPE